MATHSGILSWRNSIDRGAWLASQWDCKELDMSEHTVHCILKKLFLHAHSTVLALFVSKIGNNPNTYQWKEMV